MYELHSAGIVLYRVQDNVREYLLLHYPHGHWDLPKGKMEKGETLEQAAHRELMEETGLKATLIDGFQDELSYFFKEEGQLIKKTVTFFIGHALGNKVMLSHEHIGFEWLPYADAWERLSFDNAKGILKKSEQFLSEL